MYRAGDVSSRGHIKRCLMTMSKCKYVYIFLFFLNLFIYWYIFHRNTWSFSAAAEPDQIPRSRWHWRIPAAILTNSCSWWARTAPAADRPDLLLQLLELTNTCSSWPSRLPAATSPHSCAFTVRSPTFVHWWLWPKRYVLRTFRPKNIPTTWHYICRTMQSWIWRPPLRSLGCLVTCNVTSHLVNRDCDITSKFLLTKSGSKCHKYPGHPGRYVRSVCTVKKGPWISVPCALT
jgi:hypothetical protein